VSEFLWESERSSYCQKFPHILWIRKFNFALTKVVSILSMPQPSHTQKEFSYYFPTVLQVSPLISCTQVFFIYTCYKPKQFPSPLFHKPDDIRWGIQIINLLGMYLCPPLCYRFPLVTKYSPQHPILNHPRPLSLPKYDKPIFIPIQNKRHNYNSVYFNLIIFG